MSSIQSRLGPGIWTAINEALSSAAAGFFGESRQESLVSEVAQKIFQTEEDDCVVVSFEDPNEVGVAAQVSWPEAASEPDRSHEAARALIPSADDGSCLYHSIIQHLEFQDLPAPSVSDLRALVSATLEARVALGPNQDQEIIAHLDDAILEHNESIEKRYTEAKANLTAIVSMADVDPLQVTQAAEELERLEADHTRDKIALRDYSAYIAKVKTPHFFAAAAEIHVIAQEYNMPIHIYTHGQTEGAYRKLPIDFNRQAPNAPCELLYSSKKRHYDLLIRR